MSKKHWFIAIFLVVFIGFIVRIWNLTLLPVFVDEAIYIRWSQVMAAVPSLKFLPLQDGKQPLFMWVLMLIVNRFSDPLFIGRLVSVVCGLFTVFGVYRLSLLLFKSQLSSLGAAAIWAISPFALFFDRMALVDSMLTALGVWTFVFLVLMVRTMKARYVIVAGIALGFAMLTKSPALFLLMLVPFSWLVASRPVQLIKLGIFTAIVWLIAFAMYNIQRVDPNFHLLATRNFDYVYPYDHILSSPLDPFKGHIGGIWNYFVMLVPIGLLFLVLLGILTNFKKFKKEIFFLSVLGLTPILIIAEYSKVVTARYILFTLPFLAVLAASSFRLLWGGTSLRLRGRSDSRRSDIARMTVLAFGVIFAIHSLYIDVKLLTSVEAAPLPHGERNGYLEEWTAGQGIREIADYIKNEHASEPNKKIVVGTEGYFGTLPNGLQMYLEGVDNVVTIGVGLGISDLPTSLNESYEFGNKTYLVVNKSRLVGDPSELGLVLIASYEKPERLVGSVEYTTKGSRETLYFFKVEQVK